MTGRSYIGVLTRSNYSQAHKKLTDLYLRWNEAQRLLEPSIDLLPHLMIIPVALFTIGLLDNILSSAIPLSSTYVPIIVAGLIASAFAILVAVYTIWTVYHACRHPETSPFQSTVSQLVTRHVPPALMQVEQLCRALFGGLHGWSTRKPSQETMPISLDVVRVDYPAKQHGPNEERSVQSTMTIYEHEAFYSTLLQVHEDDTLDQAVAAYFSVIDQHRIDYIARAGPPGVRQYHLQPYHKDFGKMLVHMLSAEASLRTNITAAIIMRKCITSSPPHWSSDESDTIYLLQRLVDCAKRYSLATTGVENSSEVLWTSPFSVAMLLLVDAKSEFASSNVARHEHTKYLIVAPLAPLFCLYCMEEVAYDPALKFLKDFLTSLLRPSLLLRTIGQDFTKIISMLFPQPWFWLILSRTLDRSTDGMFIGTNLITRYLSASSQKDAATAISTLYSVVAGISTIMDLLDEHKMRLYERDPYSFNQGPLLAFQCLLEGLDRLIGLDRATGPDGSTTTSGYSGPPPSTSMDWSKLQWVSETSSHLITTLDALDLAIHCTHRTSDNASYTKSLHILDPTCTRGSDLEDFHSTLR